MTPAQAEAKRQAEVMIAFSEGKEIQILRGLMWMNSESPTFNWEDCDYRIAAPKPKKVKFLCWSIDDRLHWLDERRAIQTGYKRVPELDREVEVVEP